jgi:ABC-type branched-subunit amino acid transport system substrate-binding protein
VEVTPMNVHTRARGLLIVLVVLAVVAVGCGGGGRGQSAGSSGGKPGAPATATGFDGKTITVGAISPQTGIASIIGIPLTAGNQVYFDALNAKGGIAGKYKVKLEVRDSAYNSNTAQQNYSDLRDSVAMLAQVLGTDITNALLTPMRQDDMVASPATLDAQWVRDPNLLPVAAPYQIEAINGLDYWVNQGGGKGKTLCVIRSDDLYGQAGLDGVKFAASKLDFKLGKVAEFPAASTDLTAQLQEVRSGCDAVWLVALPTATIPTMGAAAGQALDVRWMGQAPTWVSLLSSGSTGDYVTKHFWLAAQGPQWGDLSSPGMKQMLADVAKYKPDQKPDLYFAFGYAQALTVSKLLEKAVALGDLSHAGIKKALNGLGTVDTLGLAGTYKYGPPDQRVPPEQTTIFAVDAAVPGALKALKVNYESKTVKSYSFPKGG